jgi:anti-sigma regulatory factor (Ser/Thr protein kinase)
MSDALWGHRSPPETAVAEATVWREALRTSAQLSAFRQQLRAVVQSGLTPAGPSGEDLDRLLLALEELGSNGLRHGDPPGQVTVAMTGTGWVLDVTDAAVERPPTPAVGRDAALGGLGMYLIARIAAAHGWAEVDGRKHVWASIDFTTDIRPGL